jgi:integrase
MVQRGYIRHAIATLLAFDCFLRVGELVNLRRADVATTNDARMGSDFNGTALRLRQTKTGPNQWVRVDNKDIEQLLLLMVDTTEGAQSKLFPFSANQYRSVFKAVCASLGLSSSYVPHSLRHGGATRWHLLDKSIEDILLRGRWASTKSARRYVQAGRAMLLATHVPPSLAAAASVLSQNLILSLVLSLSQLH